MSRQNGKTRPVAADVYRTCFHEAGHAVAGFLVSIRVESIYIADEAELRRMRAEPDPDDVAGRVILAQRPIDSLGVALDEIFTYLAGEAALRSAWALGALDEMQLGFVEPAAEVTAETMAELPANVTPITSASYYGYQDSERRKMPGMPRPSRRSGRAADSSVPP